MDISNMQPGNVIGNRFELVKLADTDSTGQTYKAQDKESKRFVALKLISLSQIGASGVKEVRRRLKEVSSMVHPQIRSTYGMGTFNVEKEELIYISTQWVDGTNLRKLLDKRNSEKLRFSFKGAYNIIGHLCNALTYAHQKTPHGSICPESIIVNKAGRVKIGDWLLSTVIPQMGSSAAKDKGASIYWAPEILKEKSRLDKTVDIYSLGAIFYELIAGQKPQRPFKAPSVLGFSKNVDKVVARCMASNPTMRFPDAASAKTAFSRLVDENLKEKEVKKQVDDVLEFDIIIDDTGSMDDNEGEGENKDVQRSSRSSMINVSDIPPPPTERQGTGGGFILPKDVTEIDMGALVGTLGSSEAAHWMVQKGKFDHGPFSNREIVQMILMGDVLSKHIAVDMDTGVRKKVIKWGHFDEYLERYRIKKKKQEEQAALERTTRSEKRGTAFKVFMVLGIVGFVALAGAGYWLSRHFRKEIVYTPDGLIKALESGKIKLKTGGGLIEKERKRGSRRRGGRRGGGGGGSTGAGGGGEFVPGMSYEDAMNVATEIGSLGNSGGQKPLSPADITRIMDKNVRRFLPCMAGQSIKKVDMDIAIGGNGKVLGISVKAGSSKLKKCVASKVRSIHFPSSPAPRTAASWYFELY